MENNNQQRVSAYEYGLLKSTGGLDSTQGGPYMTPPRSLGYLVMDSQPDDDVAQPVQIRLRGDNVWMSRYVSLGLSLCACLDLCGAIAHCLLRRNTASPDTPADFS